MTTSRTAPACTCNRVRTEKTGCPECKFRPESPAHTQGPWTSDEVDTLVYDGDGSDAQVIAFVEARPTEAERQANLRLIAAAPDLLMAAKDAREYVRFLTTEDSFGKDDPEAMIRLLDKAIAKAEGR